MSEITRDTLMAHADGQLDPAARTALEAHLAAHPESAAELAHLRRQADAIRTLYPSLADAPLPARLDPHRLALRVQRRRFAGLARAAMILAVLGTGLLAGWLLRPWPAGPDAHDRLIADAVSAHTVYAAESRHAVEVEGGDSAHLSRWLSNRLAAPLAMPDLSAQGLAFLGGRLLPAPEIAGGRAAQLMYEDAAGARLTLYVTPATGLGDRQTEILPFGADNALYWADATFTCTIVGPQDIEILQAIARSVFSQLSPGQAGPYRDL